MLRLDSCREPGFDSRAHIQSSLRPLHLYAGGPAGCRVIRGRHNSAEPQHAEEPLPAGIAPVSGKFQKALQGDHCPLLDALARNMLQVKISASGAMCVARERQRYARGTKPEVAGVAPPTSPLEQCEDEINGSASMRTKAIRTAALRTDHSPGPPWSPVRKNIQFRHFKQDSVSFRMWKIPRLSGVE